MLLFEHPETSQILPGLPEESRTAWEGVNQPREVVRAKQLLGKGGAGVGVECPYPGAFRQLHSGQRGSEESPGRNSEASSVVNYKTLGAFLNIRLLGLEIWFSSSEYWLLLPSTHKATHNHL